MAKKLSPIFTKKFMDTMYENMWQFMNPDMISFILNINISYKNDIYDYSGDCRIGDNDGDCLTIEEVKERIALDLKDVNYQLQKCFRKQIRKGIVFYRDQDGWWNTKNVTLVDEVDDKWAKTHLEKIKEIKKKKKEKSSILCGHANEVPAVCKCP